MSNWRRVTRRDPCPICGGAGWCAVSANGEVCLCMRTESDWPSNGAMGGHVHRLSGEARAPAWRTSVDVKSPLTPSTRREISEWLLDHLGLEEPHREHLTGAQRQLTDEQIEHRRYRSWPGRDERRRLAVRAHAMFGASMSGYPGYHTDRHRDSAFVGPEGLLLPVRDLDGNIAAFQVRPDSPSSGKRLWLSSSNRRNGAGSGAPSHVSAPRTRKNTREIYVVEGVLSADICSDRLGAVSIGLSGMTNWRSVNWLELIEAVGTTCVVIALDQDKDGHAEQERYSLRAECGQHVETRIATWNGDLAKGLDDCLIAGLTFTTD